jgi:RNA polymerase sigma factor (sigma-70 family)
MDDWELIRDYAASGSQQAFQDLVDRHIDFVYSAALRQVRDSHLAQDVTQMTFMVLARKAGALARQNPGVLPGWLFNTVRYSAANALKTERRRRIHEAKRSVMNPQSTENREEWDSVSPHLDAAIADLRAADRDAVLLRFFSGKSHRDIGEVMGISEEAAKKRVNRAIDKLRQILGRRGVTVGAVALAALMETQSVQAAPVGLSATCGATAIKGAVITTAAANAKLIALSIFAAVLVAGSGGLIVKMTMQARATVPLAQNAPPAIPRVAVPIQPVAAARTGVGGVVRSNGEAIAGAEVLLALPKRPVDVYDTRPSGAATTKTGDDGSFSFDVPAGPCLIVVRHDLGYAQVTREQLEQNTQVTLEPWGKIEGVVKVGSKPATGQTVMLSRFTDGDNNYSMLAQHNQTTAADADGHFVFDRVAPGEAWVHRQTPPPRAEIVALKYVDVKGGAASTVNLGGAGRPVVGRFALPPGSDEKIEWTFKRTSSFTVALMPTKTPLIWERQENSEQKTWEERRIFREKWARTPAGKMYRENGYGVSAWVEPDGSFRFDDVAPGTHSLGVQVWRNDTADFGETVAGFRMPVTVGDLAAEGGQSDKPLDLGTLTLELHPRLRLGKPAPPFTVGKLDGSGDVKLADFAGKFVLVVFWSDARKPSDEDVRFLKLAQDRHKKEGNLVLLTVEWNGDGDAARRLAEATKLVAVHCVGRFSRGGVADLFARNVVPKEYFQTSSLITLIDPDGKVAAKNLSGENIEGAVHRAIFER